MCNSKRTTFGGPEAEHRERKAKLEKLLVHDLLPPFELNEEMGHDGTHERHLTSD